jgi:hypothetical protein
VSVFQLETIWGRGTSLVELGEVLEGEQLENQTLVLGGKLHRSSNGLVLRLAHSDRHRAREFTGVEVRQKWPGRGLLLSRLGAAHWSGDSKRCMVDEMDAWTKTVLIDPSSVVG